MLTIGLRLFELGLLRRGIMSEIKPGTREFDALYQFLRQASVPILSDKSGPGIEGPGVEGAGLLFRRSEKHFLITAEHVANGLNEGVLGFPAKEGGEVWTVGKGKLASHPTHDVAAMRIDDPATLARLSDSGYRIILDDSNMLRGRSRNSFWMFGYPARLADGTLPLGPHGEVAPKGVLISTRIYDGDVDHVSTEAMPKEWNLVLQYPEKKKFQDMGGVSGSPIWAEIEVDDESELWNVHSRFKIAAIQTGFVYGSWIQSTHWRYVEPLINALL